MLGRESSSVWNNANECSRYLRNVGTKYQLHGVTRQKTVYIILVLGTLRTSNNFTSIYQGFQNEGTNKRECQYCMNSRCYYLLSPWSRVPSWEANCLQLVKKFPAFYGTRRFLTALTSARHLSLSWASPMQSSHPHPTSWRSILTLSSHLRLGLLSGLFPSGFPTRTGSLSAVQEEAACKDSTRTSGPCPFRSSPRHYAKTTERYR
jgi:sucrose-6-phosphate hydrolase SacC (GH32 family)